MMKTGWTVALKTGFNKESDRNQIHLQSERSITQKSARFPLIERW